MSFLNAQENLLTVSEVQEDIDNTYAKSLLFAKEDHSGRLFVVQKIFKNSSEPKGYYVKKYSGSMAFEEKIKIDIEGNELRGMFVNEGKIFLIQFEYSREEKVYNINLLSSNIDSLNFKKTKLFSVNRQDIDKYDKFGNREKPVFPNYEDFNEGGILVSSENSNYYCYSLRLKKTKSKRNLFLLFNKDFGFVDSYIFEEKTKGTVLVSGLTITNNGEIYFLNKKFEKDISVSKITTSNDNYSMRLHSLSSGECSEIDYNNEYSRGSAFISSLNGEVYVYGYFSDKKNTAFNSVGYSGVFMSQINTEFKNISLFNKYYFKDILKNKNGKPIEEISRNLSFKNFFIEESGLIFNSEIHSLGGNNNACVLYGNIISTKFHLNGELVWMRAINKNQGTCWGKGKTNNYSFVNLYNSNKLYFLMSYAESEKEIKDGDILSNVLTIEGVKDLKKLNSLSGKTVSELYYKNFINLSNESVLIEGIDIVGNPTLIKILL